MRAREGDAPDPERQGEGEEVDGHVGGVYDQGLEELVWGRGGCQWWWVRGVVWGCWLVAEGWRDWVGAVRRSTVHLSVRAGIDKHTNPNTLNRPKKRRRRSP